MNQLTKQEIEILYCMHWKNSNEMQRNAIQAAINCKNLSFLFQPKNFPYSWENCARAIYKLEDERLEKYLDLMFEWLQDMNWFGAIIIAKRLIREYTSILLRIE